MRSGRRQKSIQTGPDPEDPYRHQSLQEFDSKLKSFVKSSTELKFKDEEKRPLLADEKEDDEEENRKKNLSNVSIFTRILRYVRGERTMYERTIYMERSVQPKKYCPNTIKNQKYNPFTFIFVILYEQFRFFSNAYFLVVALSQFIPALQVGFLFTYVSPLAFVLLVTIVKEAYDDFKRILRDREANGQRYAKLTRNGVEAVPSSDIQVGDLIFVDKDQRVPADMVFLRTTEKNGSCFIRTDQLDGETDWKLRKAVAYTQRLASDENLIGLKAEIYAEKPKKDIYHFIGNFSRVAGEGVPTMETEGLSVENCLWTNTIVASGRVIGAVVYTGRETRSVMNTSAPESKVGLLELEINLLSKVLCVLLLIISFVEVALKGFDRNTPLVFFRFMLLFSAIIPISLRVNLDMAKIAYSVFIMKDKNIPETVVRTSTIPEELGRIDYLLSDKTGTLTQNDMIFKKLHLGSVSFSKDTLDEVQTHLENAYNEEKEKRERITSSTLSSSLGPGKTKIRRTVTTKVREAVRAIALCHNVTPVEEGKEEGQPSRRTYQASSPDEIALVQFSESVCLPLESRDINSLALKDPLGELEEYEILNIFPFTSETKRMGIILKHKVTNAITFYMKGADAVMAQIVQFNDWLEEECGNMAREGLRTLVFGKKNLTTEAYNLFTKKMNEAKSSIHDRDALVQKVIQSLETDLELLCLTGVEDKLQEDVKITLETLANAGIKVWMLTGDKVETAKCIATSARLVSRNQSMHTVTGIKTKADALAQLQTFSNLRETCLVIDGSSLAVCLENLREKFIEVACRAPCVVCCRCSPTQKAEIVKAIKELKKAKTCAIGDGGNDVSMIQAADVGVGIVGKEGKQASLAADFSINQFSYVSRLLLWHGRNSYKRSARLSQFIIHRGLIISFIQAVFSAIFYFAAIAIYNGWLIVGYSTLFTMAPVFNLVLDEDVSEEIVFKFPELYKELQKGRALSLKTFFIWTFTSIYQAGTIMILGILLFESNLVNIVSITYTALILTELLNVAFEIHKWTRFMMASEFFTLLIYLLSMLVLRSYFDLGFIFSWAFAWRVSLITFVTCLPLFFFRVIKRKLDPPSYSKLS
eukprot:TRINITY_DN4173_c0_g2_i2.p1 TRINITY_DN4173_c0_g2~~TRINITY_DN4173_c0_g2_i2.p1  ORF type:complete len:1099 (+),score=335.10 TRINITY_DN4173_c0_g2_i2:86-3382(+)